jgi:2-iminobutanoate/2-iminopropanoate deaminase
MTRRAIPNPPGSTTPLSPAIIVDGIVYASGQIGRDPVTGEVPADIRAQVSNTIDNLRAVLRQAGADLKDVVKTTVFLTRQSDFGAMNELYAQQFPEPRPARSTIVVAALARPGIDVEIEAVAYPPKASGAAKPARAKKKATRATKKAARAPRGRRVRSRRGS